MIDHKYTIIKELVTRYEKLCSVDLKRLEQEHELAKRALERAIAEVDMDTWDFYPHSTELVNSLAELEKLGEILYFLNSHGLNDLVKKTAEEEGLEID